MTTDITMDYETLVVIAFFVLWICTMPAVAAVINISTRCNLALLLSGGGKKLLKILTSDTKDNVSGYIKSDLVRVKPHQNCMPSLRVKPYGMEGTYKLGVEAVEIDANKKWQRQADLAFSKGMDNWTWKQITFQAKIGTRWAYGDAREL